MNNARDLINAHLYPVLATFAVIYGAIQIAPIAQQARDMNACVQAGVQARAETKSPSRVQANVVASCNGWEGGRHWLN